MDENQEPIRKNKSVTETERYLKKLCDKTFLSLWSYPNVFRDQKDGLNPEGKELCDLLVVFDNHVIIFSDKRVAFPETGDLGLDWARWYRKAVKESAKQAFGAERWIRKFPDRIFLDRACSIPFPYDLPKSSEMKVHIIVVSHEASKRCKKEMGGSGSMMLVSNVDGYDSNKPFTISDCDRSKTFVHVLDDTSMDVLLKTNDTVSDFVEYLTKKEFFFRSGNPFSAAGEEELLAYYLRNIGPDGKHDFSFDKKYKSLVIQEGCWQEFADDPIRKGQVLANEVSYFWDELIERFSFHVIEGTQYNYSTTPVVQDAERVLRVMAAEPRTHRRILSKAFLEIINSSNHAMVTKRLVKPINSESPHYLFLLWPRIENISAKDYRNVRNNALYANCLGFKYRLPDIEDIVGIAVEPGVDFLNSEDAMYLDVSDWSAESQKDAEELMKKFGIPYNAPTAQHRTEKEYPDLMKEPLLKSNKFSRNELCLCGSGLKYKKCQCPL